MNTYEYMYDITAGDGKGKVGYGTVRATSYADAADKAVGAIDGQGWLRGVTKVEPDDGEAGDTPASDRPNRRRLPADPHPAERRLLALEDRYALEAARCGSGARARQDAGVDAAERGPRTEGAAENP